MPFKKDNKNIHQKIKTLISKNGEIFVEHYIKRAIQRYYFLKSSNDLENMLSLVSPHDFLTVYKKVQLPLREIVDNTFEEKVLSEYSKLSNPDYSFFNYVSYPNELESYGAGSSLSELHEDLKELINDYNGKGLELCFGADPRPIYSAIHLEENEDFIIISG